MSEIKIVRTTTPKEKPQDETKLGFGAVTTDHMFIMNYTEGKGWHDPRIVPYGPIELDPFAKCLHYGQEVFEGLKAYRGDEGQVLLFRPDENFKRINRSNDRMCIPQLDEALCLDALHKLVELDKDWVPHAPGTSLYIRPFVIATEAKLGTDSSKTYLFLIVLSPSGAYYPQGFNPVKIYVETKYVRAVRGGMGEAKTGGNYACSLKGQEVAHEQGYSQVLWLDGVERKYIEEVGAMNVFFVIDDEIVTPMLTGSILPGITRKSCIELLKNWGYRVSERRLSVDELLQAGKEGRLKEAFGSGTAAVISPIGELKIDEHVLPLSDGKIGPISQKLYDQLTGIQWGRVPGPEGWSVKVCD